MKSWLAICVVCCSSLAAACGKQEVPAPRSALEVRSAWARAADSGASTAIYFTLGNGGAVADTLTAVVSAEGEETAMHVSMQHGGTMHMSPVTQLPVPANDSVSFRPLGAHVMVSGLRRGLVVGDTVRATLRFVSGATLEVRAGVRTP